MAKQGALLRLLFAAATAGGLYLGYSLLDRINHLQQALAQESARTAAWQESAQARLGSIDSEITRIRIEQRVGGQGPQALLQMLRIYGEALVNSRTTAPDYLTAQQQMRDVLRAFESLGKDGVQPLRARLDQLDPQQHFEELRWILEALSRCDVETGKELLVQALQGKLKPNPRLRWAAADLLRRVDLELARRTLRQILLTETNRGIDPDRAAAYGAALLDPAAVAATGFFNFVTHYLRTEDPAAEDTLLQVLARPQQDVATLQETIEALGGMRSARAAKRIEDLYLDPPLAQQNPIFLNKCLDALVAIRGHDSKAWLQQQLAKTDQDLVAKHIGHLLATLEQGAANPPGPDGAAGEAGR